MVLLRVRLTNFRSGADEVRIELNGRPLPESILQKTDVTMRVLKTGFASPYGYIFEYRLTPEYYPQPGRNGVKVTLLRRDPRVKLPFAVYDLDCSIQYGLHRDFESNPTEY